MAKHKQESENITPADVGAAPQEIVPAERLPLAAQQPMNEAAREFLQLAEGPREVPQKIPLITIDHKTGHFILPSAEVVEEVSGYPVYYFHTRRFYKRAFQSGQRGTPPDCWSSNMVEPHPSALEKQCTMCAACAMNQFGTARDGRGKACSTYTWVFLLNPTFGVPPVAVVVAPPSSLRTLIGTRFQGGYFSQAAARHGVYEIVWTTLKLAKPDPSAVHSVIFPEMGEAETDKERVRTLAKIRNQLRPLMDELRMKTPAMQEEDGAGGEAGDES